MVIRQELFSRSLTLMAANKCEVALFRALECDTFTPFGLQHSVHYYQTGAYREVDFPFGTGRIRFESKYAESVDRRDAQVLEQAIRRMVVAIRGA